MIGHKFKTCFSSTDGFTLIELIVALSLTVVVIGLIGTFFVSNYVSFNDARDMDTLLADVGTVTKSLDQSLRESKGVVEVKKEEAETEYHTLTLLEGDGTTRVTFSFSGTTITQKIGDGSEVVLTTHASDFKVLPVHSDIITNPIYVSDLVNSFTAVETRGIQYVFTLKAGKATREVLSQITFRNKD